MSQENVEVVQEALAPLPGPVTSRGASSRQTPTWSTPPGSPFANASGHQGFRNWLKDVNDAFEKWEARVRPST